MSYRNFTKMRQIDIFRKVIRRIQISTVFPKPYTHTPTNTGISQRRAPQTKISTTVRKRKGTMDFLFFLLEQSPSKNNLFNGPTPDCGNGTC
jgi:hypothetical protein